MHLIDKIRHNQKKLRLSKEGGERLMLSDELTIGSIRAQAERLKHIINQLESDGRWKENGIYYAKEIHNIEKTLRMIRKKDFESMHIYETCGV
jgi:hypothetical protein